MPGQMIDIGQTQEKNNGATNIINPNQEGSRSEILQSQHHKHHEQNSRNNTALRKKDSGKVARKQ
jgi:hypothetical protein